MSHFSKKLVFSEDDMTSDPEPKAPTVKIVEVPEDLEELEEEKARRSDVWFDTNKNVRVPIIALEEDIYKIPDQNFACFSVIRPEDYGALHHKEGDYKGSLIKFRGVFASREEADKHIRKVMKADKHFDIHLVPCFTWAAMDDDSIENREYMDNNIQEIIKGYFKEENNRMKGVSRRIRNTEEDLNRSEEITDFFEKSQGFIEDRPPVRPAKSKPVSLSELADALEIKPGGETVLTKTLEDEIPKEKLEAVVSEIILEESDDDDELMKPKPKLS
jgi:hypothetical protein